MRLHGPPRFEYGNLAEIGQPGSRRNHIARLLQELRQLGELRPGKDRRRPQNHERQSARGQERFVDGVLELAGVGMIAGLNRNSVDG